MRRFSEILPQIPINEFYKKDGNEGSTSAMSSGSTARASLSAELSNHCRWKRHPTDFGLEVEHKPQFFSQTRR
jgi:hypothetical protein